MKKKIVMTALVSSLATLGLIRAWSAASVTTQVKLEHARVMVKEMVYPPGVPRERYIRPTDQVIVFLDDCRYERTDSQTGEKTTRQRRSGDVIWHDKGEDAPVLRNLGTKPYRTIVIELK